jgi:tRNA-Thr(GGU) m(6)t(6)A37 methyltransferase TsaA
MADTIELRPIGRVHAGGAGGASEIKVYEQFADGLEGVETLEHLWVLYWLHELAPDRRQILRAHPRGDRSRPEQGVFSLHSPMRPNPIAITRVKLRARRGNRLTVEGLDARDGSPVLDIKSG